MSLPPPPPPPPAWHETVVDTECYINYWFCAFEDGNEVEIWDDRFYVNNVEVDHAAFLRALNAFLRGRTLVTFNGIEYDLPIITLALNGNLPRELKRSSDALILMGVKHWDIARVPEWIDHIDLFNVSPGAGSLKSYAARMHAKRLQDLPFEAAATIDAPMREVLKDYCKNSDIPGTRLLRDEMSAQVQLRVDMSKEYGVDLRSKSDAQIAEAVMKTLLPSKVEVPYVMMGTQFYYAPPAWLKFESLQVLELLARSPFTISDKGSPIMTEELANTLIRIGDGAYQMGSGGLHSTESAVTHVASDDVIISDHDVASYYPSLIIKTGIYPSQIGPVFLEIYQGWYERRLTAKEAGDKKKANSLKTLLNGTFGKLGSRWSIFYAPASMIQVTITGQLALLMLIEKLESFGIRVISANTDGIVLKTPRALLPFRDAIISEWEVTTGLVTEVNQYRLLASRDVNSYIAITPNGTVKTKGDYADPVPGPSGWPNPKRQICVDAVIAWLRDKTPIETTIYACRDLRKFVCMIKVTGGGYYCPDGALEKKATQKFMRSVCGEHLKGVDLVEAYEKLRAIEKAKRSYLGKTVRWYYAKGSRACIVTPAGNHVQRTEGCWPIMTFPDEFPDNIDYDWYIAETKEMLHDIGAVS